MRNLGTENCGTCGFNRANQVIEGYIRSAGESYCVIRDIVIGDAFKNGCPNWYSLSESLHGNVDRDRKPKGIVMATGFVEKAPCAVPWHGSNEPRAANSGRCFVCGREFTNGIEVINAGEVCQFCCCAHYVRWWRKSNKDAVLTRGYDFGYYDRP